MLLKKLLDTKNKMTWLNKDGNTMLLLCTVSPVLNLLKILRHIFHRKKVEVDKDIF